MNIQMQVGGLLILFLVLFFYKRHGTVGLYAEKLFRRALYVTIVCLILDIVSIVLIVNRDSLPLWLVEFECKAYLISLVWNGYMALSYASADTHYLMRMNRLVQRFGVAVVIASMIILLLPINIYCEGSVAYTYGPACLATYCAALITIIFTIYIVLTQRSEINPKRVNAILMWMTIWIALAVTQFFFEQFLLVGFAGVMGIVILFFELENPEANIDRRTGFFNNYTFVDYLKQKYKENAFMCGMLVSFEDIHARDIPSEQLDEAFAEIADFFRHIPNATLFRTEDREFTLVFDNHGALENAYHMVSERFKNGWLEKRFSSVPLYLEPQYIIMPTASVAKSADELIGFLKYFRAHVSKASDNNVMIIDEAMMARKRAREEMMSALISAMNEDRVEVFFQPIYSTKEKRFVSAEALVRLRKPDGTIIPPGLFIPIAEETGIVAQLGEIVFEKTCRFIKENDIEQYGIRYIEINLSVVQCENAKLAKNCIDIMEKYKVKPPLINLEITETASVVMKKTLMRNMQELIDYGVEFSLDDFGNGQSNLNYIVDMPVQIVKFDRDMTQAYFKSEKARFVLQAAMNMVHDMHLKVVAEGVETQEQFEILEAMGVDYIQGYHFSKPVEGRLFIEFLKSHNLG